MHLHPAGRPRYAGHVLVLPLECVSPSVLLCGKVQPCAAWAHAAALSEMQYEYLILMLAGAPEARRSLRQGL